MNNPPKEHQKLQDLCFERGQRISELEAALREIATMSVQDVGSGIDWSAGWALIQIEKTARAVLEKR